MRSERCPQPYVSLIICAYNEEISLSKKVENTLQIDYPRDRLEIMVFDNGSTDRTLEIAKGFEKRGVKVYALNAENKGKSAGLNVAFALAKGDIIAISDVGCSLNEDVLGKSMPNFEDAGVGAVCGSQILLNRDESRSSQMEDSLQGYYTFIRTVESNIDSTIVYNGEFLAFRKELIKRLDEDVGADDTQIAIKTKETGHRALFLENANFYEYAPSSMRTRWKQKVRRSSQVIQALLRYRHMIFKQSDTYSRIIYPWNFFMHVISPILFALLLVLLACMLFVDPLAGALTLTILASFALVGILALETYLGTSRKGFLYTLLTFIAAQFSLLVGLCTLIYAKPYKWEPQEDMRRRENE